LTVAEDFRFFEVEEKGLDVVEGSKPSSEAEEGEDLFLGEEDEEEELEDDEEVGMKSSSSS
jgi:hypothetical protein